MKTLKGAPKLYAPALVSALTLVALFFLGQPESLAWTFNERLGQLETTGDISWNLEGMDTFPEGLSITVFDADFEPMPDGSLNSWFATDEKPLEGTGSLRFGGGFSAAYIDLTSLQGQFSGRRTELRIWAQARGTSLAGRLYWYVGPNRGIDDGGYVGSISLKPTGQATSDGWREFSTGPFDWEAGGIGPTRLILQDTQYENSFFGGFVQPDINQEVAIDAFEIEDVGPVTTPEGKCTAATSAAVCGEDAACRVGSCIDGALLTDGLPNTLIREDYLARRFHQFKNLEGGVLSQTKMPQLAEAFDDLNTATSSVAFWHGLKTAVSALQDGHASAPLDEFSGGSNAGVCLVMGEPDLLPDTAPAPMVFGTTNTPVGELLQVGDVLTAVDGLNPYQWLKEAPLAPVHYGDPVVADYILTRDLISTALAAGSELTFSRCATPNTPCSAEQVETITIDLSAFGLEDFWEQGVPEWVQQQAVCDFRFMRWVEDAPGRASRYSYAGSSQRDGTAYILINGTPDPDFRNGQWRTAVTEGFEGEPTGVLLDHRSGGGGTVTGVNLVAGYMLDPESFGHINWFPFFEQGLSNDLYEAVRACIDEADGFLSQCAGGFHWDIFDAHPDPGLHVERPLAIVIGQDVSGNDFLTEALRYRSAPTRIFGSPATYGAFGTIVSIPGLPGEFSGGAVQVSDSIFFATDYEPGDALPMFTTGTGVRPDELLFQKQSDAIQGIDTVLERAQQWITEVQP